MDTRHHAVLDELREKICRLETIRRPVESPPVSSGIEPLDRLLAWPAETVSFFRGFASGSLVEWFDDGGGSAATTLAMLAVPAACADGRTVVVLDQRGEFYPPEPLRWGLEPEQLIVVRATGRSEVAWAGRESLASPAVGAVLTWPDRIAPRDFRRLQLAAEEGGGLGMLVRPAERRAEPSWAEVRLQVEPLPGGGELRRRLRIRVLRSRGVVGEPCVDVEIDESTCRVHSFAQLADPAAARGPLRAS